MLKIRKKWGPAGALQKPGFWPLFGGRKKGLKNDKILAKISKKWPSVSGTYVDGGSSVSGTYVDGGPSVSTFFEKKFLFLPGFFGGVTGVYKSFLRMHENDRDHMGICITCTDSPIT